jgi:hypothetical protein
MKTLRISGVPEHFNYPLRLVNQQQPWAHQYLKISWKEESRGSGQMLIDLKNGETDLALLLTESFLKDCASGGQNKMLGFHVNSPLIWGIHQYPSATSSPSTNSRKNFLISRMGSGSHLMALVLADREGWPLDSLSFQVVDNLDGAIAAFENGAEGYFLWEKYTTSPAVDQGKLKRIGEIPSPWPCFVWVASPQAIANWAEKIFAIRDEVYKISASLRTAPDLVKNLGQEYQLSATLVSEWLSQTTWCTQAELTAGSLAEVIKQVHNLGIIEQPLLPEEVILQEN